METLRHGHVLAILTTATSCHFEHAIKMSTEEAAGESTMLSALHASLFGTKLAEQEPEVPGQTRPTWSIARFFCHLERTSPPAWIRRR